MSTNSEPVKNGHNLPERIEKELLDASCTFLRSCGNMSKNCDSIYFDSETDYYVSLFEIAERLGIVKCIGNRKWSLEKAMRDDIDAVYKKYAALMVASAPQQHVQER